MKSKLILLTLVLAFSFPLSVLLHAANTIDAANKYAYGANLGWMDWTGDAANGAVIGEYVCSGCIYSANVGWINLGGGTPTNGIYYQNLSANDFGVNNDGLGNLSGYAWGANIGWINFEDTGAPRVDLSTGNLSGYVWSANCGWISLSNTVAYVRTDSIQQGALAPDGLPVAWLLSNFGTTNVDASADPDHDGMSNLQEYLAGTNPNDINSCLRITSIQRGNFGDPTRVDMIWTSVPTRCYAIEKRAALNTNVWSNQTEFPWMGANNAAFDAPEDRQFYRIRAYRPLMP